MNDYETFNWKLLYMKNTLFLLVIVLSAMLISCSKDDGSSTPITKSAIIGKWSTGVEGIHKYITFESDGTGFYALFNGGSMGQNYLFSYEIISDESISIEITYSENERLIGRTKLWNCSLSGDKLMIENETEEGIYGKLK